MYQMTEPSGEPRFERLGRTPIWTLVAVAVGAIGATLVVVFIGFRLFVQSPVPAPTVAGVTVAATTLPVATAVPAATAVLVANSPVAAAAGPGATCTKPLADAQSLGQAGRWSDAAGALEGVRTQCDVV